MSAAQAARYESMVFDYETTNRTDFRPTKFKYTPPTVYQPKPKGPPRKPHKLKNLETLTDYQNQPVPMTLMWKPKDIVRTNPLVSPKPCSKPVDVGREAAQRSRPRLVMTPAVSMDDVADPKVRALLVENMYKSTWAVESEDALTEHKRVCAPLPALPARANKISLARYKPPVVPSEWRMESISWDGKQLRAFVDPDKEFWLKRKH